MSSLAVIITSKFNIRLLNSIRSDTGTMQDAHQKQSK